MTNDDALYWKNRALKAEDRVAELEGVLEPFADISGEGDEDFPGETPVLIKFGRTQFYSISLSHLRAACAALAK